MEYNEQRMKQLHGTLYEMFVFFADICEKNNLTYVLIAGTALGALRHGGFIPWDDDLDVGMPREDYEKFLEIMHSMKHEMYTIQDSRNEKNYYLPFAKIRKSNTVFREEISADVYKNSGIFIDIFPVDTSDEVSSLEFKLRSKFIKLITHALMFRSCRKYYKKRTKARYFLDWITSLPFFVFSNKKLLDFQTSLMKKRNHKEKNYVVNYASTIALKKETMPYDMCFPPSKVGFVDGEYAVYAKLEEYLERMYGDYMQIPPEEKRHTHEPLELKF